MSAYAFHIFSCTFQEQNQSSVKQIFKARLTQLLYTEEAKIFLLCCFYKEIVFHLAFFHPKNKYLKVPHQEGYTRDLQRVFSHLSLSIGLFGREPFNCASKQIIICINVLIYSHIWEAFGPSRLLFLILVQIKSSKLAHSTRLKGIHCTTLGMLWFQRQDLM